MALSGLQCPYGKVVLMQYRHLCNADTWLYPFDVRMKVTFYCSTDTCNVDVWLCLFGIHVLRFDYNTAIPVMQTLGTVPLVSLENLFRQKLG